MEDKVLERLKWILLYEDIKNAGNVCFKFGISRPTFRKWLRRYQNEGIFGLNDQSRLPKTIRNIKVGEYEESKILAIRRKLKFGARRIQRELMENEGFHLSLSTIHKVLKKNNISSFSYKPIKCHYEPIFSVKADEPLSHVMDYTPMYYIAFAFHEYKKYNLTGEGNFTLKNYQNALTEIQIEFSPKRELSPYRNGKITLSKNAEKFYSTVNLDSLDLLELLDRWQNFNND